MQDSRNEQSPYTEIFLEQVATEFRFSKAAIPDLAKALGDAARWYFVVQKTPSKIEMELRIREGLEKALADVERLINTFKSLSPLVRDRVWHSLWENPWRPDNFVGRASPFGPDKYDEEVQFLDILAQRKKSLETRLADLAASNKGGRPENTALRAWVGLISAFWERTLGRKFTYSDVGRHKRGSAFEFCQRLLGPIAPDVAEQELSTAMRAIIETKPVTVRIHKSLFADETPDHAIQAFVESLQISVIVETPELP